MSTLILSSGDLSRTYGYCCEGSCKEGTIGNTFQYWRQVFHIYHMECELLSHMKIQLGGQLPEIALGGEALARDDPKRFVPRM